MNTRQIEISEYDYPLPDERIAKHPVAERDHSRLLVYRHGQISDDTFVNVPQYLPEGALMVVNNTRVIQARIYFQKTTGAHIEVFLLEPHEPADYERMFLTRSQCEWQCLIGNSKKWKEGRLSRTFTVDGQQYRLSATRVESRGADQVVRFEWEGDVPFATVIDHVGELPIPPYLNRATEESDKTTYQTVYSKIKGSVAAPTAGLHFTPAVLAAVDARGIEREELTLHVGAGTFRPVKSRQIADHEMHTEYIAVRRHTIERLIAHSGKAIAVGTTSVRTLESLYYMGWKVLRNPNCVLADLHVSQWEPYDLADTPDAPTTVQALSALVGYLERQGEEVLHSSTQIIIAPGYKYHVVSHLITNFHQPQSTLLLLVSAFVGGQWRPIYDYALSHGFRFLSYGDSSLLIP